MAPQALPIVASRVYACCLSPPRKVLDVLDDSQGRLQWDRNIKSLETVVLQEAPFRACLLCSCTKNVGIISGRDFIDVPVYLEYKDAPSPPAGPDAFVAPVGSLVNGGHGIPSHPLFPEKSGVVRGWNSPGSGWLFEPVVVEGGEVHTRVHYLIHVDLKGWIPTALVNSSLSVSAACPQHLLSSLFFFLTNTHCYHLSPPYFPCFITRSPVSSAKLCCLLLGLEECHSCSVVETIWFRRHITVVPSHAFHTQRMPWQLGDLFGPLPY